MRGVLFVLLASAAIPGASAQENLFSTQVYPILQRANCRTCHSDDGVASATRLQFPPDAPADQALEEFGRSLQELVDRENPGESPLWNKPTGRWPHTGGKLIEPGSPEDRLLRQFVDQLAVAPMIRGEKKSAGGKVPVGALPLRRLTHSQYDHIVRDIFGDQTGPSSRFPPEDFVNGFKNQREAQSVSPVLATAYTASAERVARNALRGGDRQNLIPCTPASAVDRDCAEKFIRKLGLRLFRRPMERNETESYAGLFLARAATVNSFEAGAAHVIEAMLQSPHFLYVVERGPAGGAAQYEIAARLALLFWDTAPDEELLNRAGRGELSNASQVAKVARAMLDDPRARDGFDEFLRQWLRFDRVLGTVRDRRLYPHFNPELAQAMTEETRLLAQHLVWEEKNFLDIYRARYSFLNTDLALLYGVPPPEQEFGRVDFPAGFLRAGLPGHASFLTLTSKPGDTSPTARGLFIREQLLCQHVPDPPPGVDSSLPPVSAAKPQTNRERLGEHAANAVCAGCHKLIDPIGFGLEQFDAIGRFREKLKLEFLATRGQERRAPKNHPPVELDFDTQGSIAGLPDADFTNPVELGEKLAASRQCQECIVRQYFRYAFGRKETAADRELIGRLTESFGRSGFRLKELMIQLAASDLFRTTGR